MAFRDVVAALVANWSDTLLRLRPDDLPLIADAVRALAAAPQDEQAANAAETELTALLVVRLPSGHPVRKAIAAGRRFGAGPAAPATGLAEMAELAALLRSLPGLQASSVSPASSASREPDPADWSVEDRLLAAPALTAQQVRERGADPDLADLIRLPADGAVRLPAFQFGPDGLPIPVVAAINRLLRAAEDPWGVADWWLGGNAWLSGVPAHLLGQIDDELLTRAALAEFPDG